MTKAAPGVKWKWSPGKGSVIKTKLIPSPFCPHRELARPEVGRKDFGGTSHQDTTADKGPRPQFLMSGSLFHTCQNLYQKAYSPHINTLYLEKVSSLTNRQLLDELICKKRGGEWPHGQLTQRGRHHGQTAFQPIGLIPHGWGYAQRGAGFPCPLEMVPLSMWCFTSTCPILLRTPELLVSSR